jgi:hypothetical protein
MVTDENFSFAESALPQQQPGAVLRPAAAHGARPKRLRFTLTEVDTGAVAAGGGFDPYNSTGGFDRRQAWERVQKR